LIYIGLVRFHYRLEVVFDNDGTYGFLLNILKCLVNQSEWLLALTIGTDQASYKFLLPLKTTLIIEILH
jgi:hypothetical protein